MCSLWNLKDGPDRPSGKCKVKQRLWEMLSNMGIGGGKKMKHSVGQGGTQSSSDQGASRPHHRNAHNTPTSREHRRPVAPASQSERLWSPHGWTHHRRSQTLVRRAANLQEPRSPERPGHLPEPRCGSSGSPCPAQSTAPPSKILPQPPTLRLPPSPEDGKVVGAKPEAFLRLSPAVCSWEIGLRSPLSFLTSGWARLGQQLPHWSCLNVPATCVSETSAYRPAQPLGLQTRGLRHVRTPRTARA